ncbi:MAG TPA: YitT family protein [Bacillaceae bacterium]|nr:YitT family protein [Bacillaceae bacterium]
MTKGKIRLSSLLFDYALLLAGSVIFAAGLNAFILANGLAEGGVTGIALILYYRAQWPPGWTILALNLPLFFLGWRTLGGAALVRTIFATVASSIFIEWMKPLRSFATPDLLLAALYAGVSIGLGLGLIIRSGGTTGGSDLVARIAHKLTGVNVGRAMFSFDAGVILLSIATYLDLERAMYTLVALFIGARVVDLVQETAYTARAVLVISTRPQAIARRVLAELERGATYIRGTGAYSGTEYPLLYVVVSQSELARLKQIISEEDPRAFFVVTEVHDVHGEGFTWESPEEGTKPEPKPPQPREDV